MCQRQLSRQTRAGLALFVSALQGSLAAGSTTSPRHRRGPAHGSDVVPKNSVSMVKLAQTLARPVRTLDRDAHRL
jgi:hypothetical protein